MPSRNDRIQEAYDRAYRYEAEIGSCPQCVLAALHETLGIGNPQIIQAADGLAGGTGLSTQGTCGALVGGLLALGSLVGRSYEDFSAGGKNRRIFHFSKLLVDRFVQEYGSILCCDLHQKLFGRTFDLLDAAEYQAFDNAGAHVDKCTSVSGNVAKWTAEIVLGHNLI